MPVREPDWWYGRGPSIAARILRPIAFLYGQAVVGRYRRATPYRSRLPVICIGNLVAGGTGKTPLALHLAMLLLGGGHRPVFLSRGHGGRLAGPHRVDVAVDTASDVGDEPLLLARTAPAYIARDRAAGARAIEQTDATHIIMDDGLQNPGLAKDLSIVMIDAARGIGNGLVIPAGPLRAPLAFQATLVDALVINETTSGAGALPAALKGHFGGAILRSHRTLAVDGPLLRSRPWVAFAGIGRPEGFFAMLEANGAQLVARVAFADHHPFTSTDAHRLLFLAEQHGAGLITTEKDQARLPAGSDVLGRLKSALVAPGLRLSMADADQAMLLALLARRSPESLVARAGQEIAGGDHR